jgi:ABC-type multidrug transport system permease subunit
LIFFLSSPASLNEIIAGKALTGVVYTLLIAGLLLGINRQFIQNWSLTLLTIVLGLLFVVGVGLVIGSLLKNTMQVNTWASIVLIVLLAPSFPSIGITAWFDKAMRVIPTYYLSEALKLVDGWHRCHVHCRGVGAPSKGVTTFYNSVRMMGAVLEHLDVCSCLVCSAMQSANYRCAKD